MKRYIPIVAIILLVGVVGYMFIAGLRNQAASSSIAWKLKHIGDALNNYNNQFGRYPSNLTDLDIEPPLLQDHTSNLPFLYNPSALKNETIVQQEKGLSLRFPPFGSKVKMGLYQDGSVKQVKQ